MFEGSSTVSELLRSQGMYRKTSQELIERIESDWEMIERIREGKEVLEKRNIDITKLSGKLLESAQKQAFTIGGPHCDRSRTRGPRRDAWWPRRRTSWGSRSRWTA